MEQTITNEISMNDFASIFSEGGSFADEAPVVNADKQQDDMSDFTHSVYDEESGEYTDADFDQFIDSPLDDDNYLPEGIDSVEDLVAPSELGDRVKVGDVAYDKADIERAMNLHSKIDSFASEVNAHFAELEEWEAGVNRLHAISTSEISEYIEHYQSIVDNDRVDPSTRIEALNEIKRYKAQRASIEENYKASYAQLQERKAQAERLKGKAVFNQLANMGWKENDFSMIGEYMNKNQIVVPFQNASTELMIALKKAAMFDKRNSEAEDGMTSNVQRAIAGKPSRVSKPISEDAIRAKRNKAAAMASRGELSTSDMFQFLTD
ncbi:hypothetical protein [Klebsiella variicola]|uniref:hypothetical protein n=1 Tax=Klebsiella variicola TaxID=244366 RepID=UPI0034DE536C